MKKEGGMVVNKNVYPPLLPPLSERKKKDLTPPPPASLLAPTQSWKMLLVIQHVEQTNSALPGPRASKTT